MSMDTNKLQEKGRILREITAAVNNSPSILLDQFRCMRLNETFEDIRSGNESLNLVEISGPKELIDNHLNETNDLYVTTNEAVDPLNSTKQSPLKLDQTTESIESSSSTFNSLETVEQKPLQLNTTIEFKESSSNTLNNSEVLEQKSTHLNDTVAVEPISDVQIPSNTSNEKITQPDENIESVNPEGNELDSSEIHEEKHLNPNETSEKVEAESNELNFFKISGQNNPEIEQEEPLAELDNTLTLSPLQAPEDREVCLASEEYVTPTDEIFQDPKDFDFLLHKSESCSSKSKRLESLYVKFDPLYESNMLPQSNTIAENEEQNENKAADVSSSKHMEVNIEAPSIEAPKRHSIAAIDKLVSSLTVDKAKLATEIKDTKEVEKVLIADVAKELEAVKSVVLQLELELEKQKKINDELQKKNDESNSLNHKLDVIVDEYEDSISRIIAQSETERAKLKSENEKLQEELRVSNQHLSNSEAAFNDVHEKYERLKGAVQILNKNEKTLKESIQDNIRTIEAIENRYQILKSHASEQLEKANIGLASAKKQHEAELVKERAKLARAELQCKSLAETIEQKTNENRELTKILDEIIARVDPNH